MTDDPILTAARALAYDLGLTEEGPHGPELRESAARKIQAFALKQQAEGMRQAASEADNSASEAPKCDHSFYDTSCNAWECTRYGGCHCEAIMADAAKMRDANIALATRLEAQAKEIEG